MSKNDITGDRITSKKPSKKYDEGYDRIFVNKKMAIALKESDATLEDAIDKLEKYLDGCKEENKNDH